VVSSEYYLKGDADTFRQEAACLTTTWCDIKSPSWRTEEYYVQKVQEIAEAMRVS
jgi:hypothetical protein